MNKNITDNFGKLKLSFFYLPVILLFIIIVFLYMNDALSQESYLSLQKEWFLIINKALAPYSEIMHNLTQLGDGLILLSFLTILIVFSPKLWESLITAFIVSGLITNLLKNIFRIKRPCAAYLNEQFTVIGDRLTGHNSFPSGHSITIFTVLSIVLFAFLPNKTTHKILWIFFINAIGIILIVSRVAVGAHHPLDIICGSILGYISAISGILLNRKFKLWTWIFNKKFYPFFMALFITSGGIIIFKILHSNLIIFYLALLSLIISLLIITNDYFKKRI